MSTLILGATSRVASRVAHRYAAAGHDVVLAAIELEEAQALAADVRLRHQVKAVAIRFDATDFDAHPAVIAEAAQVLGGIDVALIAFGAMGDAARARQEFSAARQVIEINYSAAVSVAELLAAHMVARGKGTLIGIASVAGDRGRQSNYLYGSAKGALALYLQGLRNRLHKDGVHVLTVKPGFMDTRMTWGVDTGRVPVLSPEAAAEAIFRAAERGADVVYLPPFWRLIMGGIRAIPEALFKRMSL
ncbi:MAG: SDR family oxidoreductase [Deltaproteobacteria bacterium]|nr:SDR family oxidoreductase [Deltaproteobacteria bacterium]